MKAVIRYGIQFCLLQVNLFPHFKHPNVWLRNIKIPNIIGEVLCLRKMWNFLRISLAKTAEVRFCGGRYCLISGLVSVRFSGQL